jgi:hypothetical protein
MRTASPITIVLLATLTLALTLGVSSAHASPQVQGLSATITRDYVSVSINYQLSQNLTELENSFAFPAFSGVLVGSNASSLATIVQHAVDNKVPGAAVSELTLGLVSTPWSNNTGVQWFNVSLQFQIRGVQSSQVDAEKFDMSWKSFEVPQNMTIGTAEVNNIGATYLFNPMTKIAADESVSSSFIKFKNVVNDRIVSPKTMAGAAAAINLFNFSRILPGIDTWKQTYDFSSGSIVWTFNPGPSLGVIITRTFNEPPSAGPSVVNNLFTYNVGGSISAPAKSSAQGDIITARFDSNIETIMAATIGSILVLGTVSFGYERRAMKKGVRRSPKR